MIDNEIRKYIVVNSELPSADLLIIHFFASESILVFSAGERPQAWDFALSEHHAVDGNNGVLVFFSPRFVSSIHLCALSPRDPFCGAIRPLGYK